jgi:general secretion pathway protein A
MLALVDPLGSNREVVLAKLSDDKATLIIDGVTRDVPLAELTRYWFGDYFMLWQPGSVGASPLAFGARGPAVRQLRSNLLRLARQPVPATMPLRYDDELMRLVEDFQRRSRLVVDGVAGEQTLVALDAALPSPGTPLLSDSNTSTARN